MMVALRNALVGNKKQESEYWGLCFTAEEANSTIAMSSKSGSPPARQFVVSYDDGNTWQPFNPDSDVITLANVGDKVCMGAAFGNTYTQISTGQRAVRRFTITGAVAASGNIMSLLVNDKNAWQSIQIGTSCFRSLFYSCNITSAPELPSTLLNTHCYYAMFQNCSLLRTAPSILPCTSSYSNMYYYMFYQCHNLETTPEIMLTENGAQASMVSMFQDCVKLNEIKVHLTDWGSYGSGICTRTWAYNVSSTGVFHCPSALGTDSTITRGMNYCPEGWTVINDV